MARVLTLIVVAWRRESDLRLHLPPPLEKEALYCYSLTPPLHKITARHKCGRRFALRFLLVLTRLIDHTARGFASRLARSRTLAAAACFHALLQVAGCNCRNAFHRKFPSLCFFYSALYTKNLALVNDFHKARKCLKCTLEFHALFRQLH